MRSNKKGFTLIELMVVAIIVAILAAVAIPLMSGNRARAVATEGQAGCSTIRTAVRVAQAQNAGGALPGGATGAALTTGNFPGIRANDLDGAYFDTSSYVYAVSGGGFTITATALARAPAQGTVVLTVAADGNSTWSGTLIQ